MHAKTAAHLRALPHFPRALSQAAAYSIVQDISSSILTQLAIMRLSMDNVHAYIDYLALAPLIPLAFDASVLQFSEQVGVTD